jgi:16S rRNA (uracil1498-N3)-methyltransferase
MKLHRFLVTFPISQDQFKITEVEVAHQLTKVLRARAGYEFLLVNEEEEVRVRVDKLLPDGLEVSVLERKQVATTASNVTLFCAILKRDNFELVVQKATEIGVSTIVPLVTARTIKQNIRPERLQAIIKEAVEQSGRAVMPTLTGITSLDDALAQRDEFDRFLLCDNSGDIVDWRHTGPEEKIAIVVGPEGGWEPKELTRAAEAKATIVSLGNYTLRAETAAIVASYLACSRN